VVRKSLDIGEGTDVLQEHIAYIFRVKFNMIVVHVDRGRWFLRKNGN
jgi:hypothetical protein